MAQINELQKLRDELAKEDEKLIDVLESRYEIIRRIMALKEANDLPIFQPNHEKRQAEYLAKRLSACKHSKEIENVYRQVKLYSKRMQARHLFSCNIFLIGFMGAGKSTISDYLSTYFAMDIIEMDQMIAEREQMSIPDIFATYGEDYFRQLETNLLIEIQDMKNVVVSCGGGVAMRERNVEEMRKSGRIVLLTATPETILDRVKDSDDRPLLNVNKNVPYIADLMEKRRKKYEAAADISIHTDQKSVEEICEELVEKLREAESFLMRPGRT